MTWPTLRVPLRGRRVAVDIAAPGSSCGPAWWFGEEITPPPTEAEIAAVDWHVEAEFEKRRQAWRDRKAEFLRRRLRDGVLNQARQG